MNHANFFFGFVPEGEPTQEHQLKNTAIISVVSSSLPQTALPGPVLVFQIFHQPISQRQHSRISRIAQAG